MGKITHGKAGTKVYSIWLAIKKRCYRVKEQNYSNYGGRGLKMQTDWLEDFQVFYDYVSILPNYKEDQLGANGLTIDRINNNIGYQEGNIRWATRTIQNRNRRRQKSNKSGYIGVCYKKNMRKYTARITVNGNRVTLGYHESAREVYKLRIDYILLHNLTGFETELDNYKKLER